MLVNQGTIFNIGLLSGNDCQIDGVIYSMGVLSGTLEGDGPVYLLQEHVYLPRSASDWNDLIHEGLE